MKPNQATEKLWQEEPNSTWYTNVQPVCELCGSETQNVVELKINEDDKGTRVCLDSPSDCLQKTMKKLFSQNCEVEHLLARGIVFKPDEIE